MLGEVVERDAHLPPVDELEGEVVEVLVALVQEGERVVVAVAVQPDRAVADPVGHREAEHVDVEGDERADVRGEVVHVLEAARVEGGEHVRAAEDGRGAVLREHALEERDAVARGVLQAQAAAAHGDVDLLRVDAVRGQPVGGLRQRRPALQLVGDELDAGGGGAGRHEVEAEVLVGAAQQGAPASPSRPPVRPSRRR